jgi:hypothetical protein
MNQTIVYPKESNDGVVLLYPNLECGLTFEEIARKDVPAGLPYIIVSNENLPDYTFFDAFEADFSNPDGYGIGQEAWFAEQEVLNDNN